MESVSLKNANFEWLEPKENGIGIYAPKHEFVRNFYFKCEAGDEGSELQAAWEASFVDAIAHVGELNGFDQWTIAEIVPMFLRMLKSKSEWAK